MLNLESKRKSRNRRNYFQYMYLSNGSCPEYMKNSKINRKIIYNPTEKKAIDVNCHFTKDIQMSYKYIKMGSSSLTSRTVKIKAVKCNELSPTTTSRAKMLKLYYVLEGRWKLENSLTDAGVKSILIALENYFSTIHSSRAYTHPTAKQFHP